MSEINYEYPLDRDYKGMTSGFARVMGLGDPTWKERHEVGVIAQMEFNDFNARLDGIDRKFDRSDFIYGWDGRSRLATIHCRHTNGKDYAKFCNFRYKKSWLEKGGRRG